MFDWIRKKGAVLPVPGWLCLVWVCVMAALTVLTLLTGQYLILPVLWVAVLVLYLYRPGSWLQSVTMENTTAAKVVFAAVAAACVIITCVMPMDDLPLWNGGDPEFRNQYELMAENLLEGRLHFDYGDEEQLLQLANPYDPQERAESGVDFHWDHAYYDGQYYMYFGIVPVLILFLPYLALTGTSLLTCQGVQVFVAVIVVGFFVLFWLLAKLFFPKLPYGIYVALSAAFSVMSVWYSVAVPTLYCVPITAAIALMIWSLYFFISAVWAEKGENRQILFAGIGALLGALVFGCRPPIALANILVLPMLIVFLRQRKITGKLVGKLVLAAFPYVVVAVCLMAYNYVRFEDPFEFGQRYQLTVADQRDYGIIWNGPMLWHLLKNTLKNFVDCRVIGFEEPFLKHGGVFCNFPILLLTGCVLIKPVRQRLQHHRLVGLTVAVAVTVLIITVMDILWTPYLLERYRMDLYFLLGVACFICLGLWHDTMQPVWQKRFAAWIMGIAMVTMMASVVQYAVEVYKHYPEAAKSIVKLFLFFGS